MEREERKAKSEKKGAPVVRSEKRVLLGLVVSEEELPRIGRKERCTVIEVHN